MTRKYDVLLAACRAFLRKMGMDEVGVEWGMETQYNRAENSISLHSGQNERTAPLYIEFMRDEYGINLESFHPTLVAFLHEVGHAATMDSFSEEDLMLYSFLKDGTAPSFYWSLPDEAAANAWVAEHWDSGEVEELASKWGLM